MLYTPYIWPILLASILMAVIAWYVLRFKNVPAALPHSIMMAAGAVWALDYALAISTTSLPIRVFLGNGTLLWGLAGTSAFLVMVIQYIGEGHWLTRRRLILLAAVPVALAAMAFAGTGGTWFRYNFRVDLSYGFSALFFSTGPLYWALIAYQSGVTLTSIALLCSWAHRRRVDFGNSLLVSLGILLPYVAGILYSFRLSPVPGLDLGPILFVCTGFLNSLVLLRGRFLDVTHVARDLVVENVEDLVIVMDSRQHVVDLNRAAKQAMGLSPQRRAGITPRTVPGPWADLFQRYPAAFVRQEVAIGSNGNCRTYDLTITPILDGRSRPLGRLFLLHDVTDRKAIEQGLRESEEKFRRLAETTPTGLYVFDGERFRLVNPAFEQITGYSEEQVASLDPMLLFHPMHREMIRERAAARQRGEPVPPRYEVKILTREREEKWVDLSIGQITYRGQSAFLGSFLDITERRRLEESVHASQALYLGIVEHQTDPVSRWLPDTTLTFVNKAYCDYFGQPRERLVGTRFRSFIPRETQELVQNAIDALFRRDVETLSQEEYNISAEGDKRWMVWAYHPIVNSEGRIVEFQSVGRDITDRKRAEQALQRANHEQASQLERIRSLQDQLREQAARDVLTGLFNRRYMQDTLDREMARAIRDHYPISIIMLDLDYFKRFNDTHGHKAGDLILQCVGKILLQQTRAMDIACRFGGEEFVVIMPTAALEAATLRAETLRRAVQDAAIEYDNRTLRVTVSIGVAAFPAHGCDGDAIVHAADQALYAAKAAGRNRVVAFQEGPPALVRS